MIFFPSLVLCLRYIDNFCCESLSFSFLRCHRFSFHALRWFTANLLIFFFCCIHAHLIPSDFSFNYDGQNEKEYLLTICFKCPKQKKHHAHEQQKRLLVLKRLIVVTKALHTRRRSEFAGSDQVSLWKSSDQRGETWSQRRKYTGQSSVPLSGKRHPWLTDEGRSVHPGISRDL